MALEPDNPQISCSVARDHIALGQMDEAYRACLSAMRHAPEYQYARELMNKLRMTGALPPEDMPVALSRRRAPFSDPQETPSRPPLIRGGISPQSRLNAQLSDITSPVSDSASARYPAAMGTLLRAYVAFQGNDLDNAWRFCTAVINSDPYNNYAYYLRGAVEERRHAIAAARQDYEIAFQLGRRVGGIRQRLARVQSTLG
jgi:tetratricopeptide (TPR) repeat protein